MTIYGNYDRQWLQLSNTDLQELMHFVYISNNVSDLRIVSS